jgi:hypothetical protein
MNSRIILLSTAAALLAACGRQVAVQEQQRVAELAQQRQAEQVANEKIRQLEARLDEADKQKAAEREAELARVKEELAQVKQDKEQAAGRIRELETPASKPAPALVAEAPRETAMQVDLERVVEEEDREPIYTGRVVRRRNTSLRSRRFTNRSILMATGSRRTIRLRFSPAGRRDVDELATVHGRPLDSQRLRMDLGIERRFRLGDVSLWPLGACLGRRLGLGAGSRMGTGLGFLAARK